MIFVEDSMNDSKAYSISLFVLLFINRCPKVLVRSAYARNRNLCDLVGISKQYSITLERAHPSFINKSIIIIIIGNINYS